MSSSCNLLLQTNSNRTKATVGHTTKHLAKQTQRTGIDLQLCSGSVGQMASSSQHTKNTNVCFITFLCPCCNVTKFFVIKPTRCTKFTNLFCHETLHVLESSSVYHQQFIHCTLSNGICHTAFRAGPGWSCSSILVLLENVYKPV